MTRIIVVTSAKGGVGKTTVVSNLAAGLTNLGQKVIVMDGNVTTPNLGLHLGMPMTKNTLNDVLKGEKRVSDVIYPHTSGYKIIPASLSVNDLVGTDVTKLPEVTFSLLGTADYVIIDSAAGLGKEAISALSAASEAIIVTNPDLPSVTDALKIAQIAKNTQIRIIGTVVNKITRLPYELKSEEIKDILEVPVIAEIPYDLSVPLSITNKRPVVEFNSNAPAAVGFMNLSSFISGVTYSPEPKKLRGVFYRFFNSFRR